MGSVLKCIWVLLTIVNLAVAQTRQRNHGLVRCYKEIGSASSECQGKYCYKMRTADDSTGEGIVKKGCMNAADAQTEVGKCTRRPLEEGGAELMCVCSERDFCNTAPSNIFSGFAVFFALLVTYLL